MILYFNRGSEDYLIVGIIGFVSNLMLVVGYCAKSSYKFRLTSKLIINPKYFVYTSFIFFLLFALYSFYTFGGIPLLKIIMGDGDPNILRGELFKGRVGFEIALLYLSAIFSYVFIPISVVLSYHYKMRFRLPILLFSIFFSISTLQKALLLNILFPLFAYLLLKKVVGYRFFLVMFVVLFVYFIVMIQSTGHGGAIISGGDFFSSSYAPSDAVDYFLWRFFAVPIYTAVDTIFVFQNWLNAQHLWGASSSLIAAIIGTERIDVEKIVFEYQFGGFNPLANANSYFAVGMYLDFSWIGLIVVSLLIGIFFKAMAQSNDLAIYSIGYLFAWQAANGSVIGIMLSSGFFYIIFHVLFLRYKLNGNYVT